jgi:chromosome partitioning protein
MIISLVNNKGGVAKTTTAVNLAAALAAQKKKILLVDLDSQGSASLSLGITRANLSPSLADALLDDKPIEKSVRETQVKNLSLITGSMQLANADLALSDAWGRELKLKRALEPLRKEFDYILIDCPPSLSLLPVMALVAADQFIVPVTPHYLALEGLVNLTTAVEKLRKGMGDVAEMRGLVLTMVDRRARVTEEIINLIREHYKEKVFKTEVRVNVRLTEAPSFGQTIFEYDARSPGAQAYSALAKEFLSGEVKLQDKQNRR